jgi:hypothetical protein
MFHKITRWQPGILLLLLVSPGRGSWLRCACRWHRRPRRIVVVIAADAVPFPRPPHPRRSPMRDVVVAVSLPSPRPPLPLPALVVSAVTPCRRRSRSRCCCNVAVSTSSWYRGRRVLFVVAVLSWSRHRGVAEVVPASSSSRCRRRCGISLFSPSSSFRHRRRESVGVLTFVLPLPWRRCRRVVVRSGALSAEGDGDGSGRRKCW